MGWTQQTSKVVGSGPKVRVQKKRQKRHLSYVTAVTTITSHKFARHDFD